MTAKTVKYVGDKLFRTISPENIPNKIHFIYFPQYRVEANQVLNVLPCILSDEILIDPNNFII